MATDEQLEKLKHRYQLEIEMIRAVVGLEQAILRPLFLLNGGALIAYLALFESMHKGVPSHARLALWLWIFGLLSATVTTFLTMRSQFRFRNQRGTEVAKAEIELGISEDRRTSDEVARAVGVFNGAGNVYRNGSACFGLISLLLFLAGTIAASAVLSA